MKAQTIKNKTKPHSGARADILARQIMTTDVIWVAPDQPVHEIAALMSRLHISAVPVLQSNRVVGIVSEGDLIQREELGTAADNAPETQDGRFAEDVMTRDVITVEPGTPLSDIASLMQTRHIKRLPVVDNQNLVGIVSRADIIRVLAARPDDPHAPLSSDDDILRLAVMDALMSYPGASPWLSSVRVSDGIVELDGLVEDENALAPSRKAAASLPDIVELRDKRTVLQPY